MSFYEYITAYQKHKVAPDDEAKRFLHYFNARLHEVPRGNPVIKLLKITGFLLFVLATSTVFAFLQGEPVGILITAPINVVVGWYMFHTAGKHQQTERKLDAKITRSNHRFRTIIEQNIAYVFKKTTDHIR